MLFEQGFQRFDYSVVVRFATSERSVHEDDAVARRQGTIGPEYLGDVLSISRHRNRHQVEEVRFSDVLSWKKCSLSVCG